MINPQQTLEPNEGGVHVVQVANIALNIIVLLPNIETWHLHLDPAEKPEHKSPVKAKHSDLDHDKEKISREDKLLSSEVNLQEHKQDEDLLSPVPLLSLKQTSALNVLVDGTGKGNKEHNGGL